MLTIWSKEDKNNSLKRRREDSAIVESAGRVEGTADDLPVNSTSGVTEAEAETQAKVGLGTDSSICGSGDDSGVRKLKVRKQSCR